MCWSSSSGGFPHMHVSTHTTTISLSNPPHPLSHSTSRAPLGGHMTLQGHRGLKKGHKRDALCRRRPHPLCRDARGPKGTQKGTKVISLSLLNPQTGHRGTQIGTAGLLGYLVMPFSPSTLTQKSVECRKGASAFLWSYESYRVTLATSLTPFESQVVEISAK